MPNFVSLIKAGVCVCVVFFLKFSLQFLFGAILEVFVRFVGVEP